MADSIFTDRLSNEDVYEADRKTMVFTPELVKKLRERHAKAVEMECDLFMFEGQELDTSYAGYLLEYLDLKMGEDGDT